VATEYIFDERFTEAFFHEPRRKVMGSRLLPFSYWHKVQLEFFQNQSITGFASLWDLWLASKICRTKYPEHIDLKQSYPAYWYLVWKALHGWRSLGRETGKFWRHVGDYASGPKLWVGKGGSKKRLAESYRKLGEVIKDSYFLQMAAQAEYEAELEEKPRNIDDSIEQVTIFMKYSGRPAIEVWNMPMGELLWGNACFLKMDGADVPIWSPSDEEAFQLHRVKRQENINAIADELLVKSPVLTQEIAQAQAAVKYWEDVVNRQAVQAV
jgi:hypothetical protein